MQVGALKLKPATKDYIWGGTKLKTEWGKQADTETVAECWELSTYPGSESEIDDARFKGYTLSKLLGKYPEFFGEKLKNFSVFPVLIKLLDASGDLSVHVHPSDEYALKNEGEYGKTEMWYVLDAEEGAYIYYGFNRKVCADEVRKAVSENAVTALLNKVYVKKGDFFLVPAGTVHALCKGVTVYEVQENSNLTYRVYDYDRKGKDGKPRELHLEKALEVSNFSPAAEVNAVNAKLVGDAEVRKLVNTDYFSVKEVRIRGEYLMYSPDSFITFTVAEGNGEIESGVSFKKGESYFLPAQQIYKLRAENALILVTTL